MKELRVRIEAVEAWLDAREPRERVVLAVGALAVVVTLWTLLLMDPAAQRRTELASETGQLEQELAELEVEAARIRAAHENDPNAALETRTEDLRRQIRGVDERIRQHTVAMISPPEMARFLEDVLAEHTDLVLVRVENLGAEPLLAGSADAGAKPGAAVGVFKHAFEVELQGRYLSTLAYLEALEALPWDFFWEGLHYEVEEYPRGRATIRAYTLSSQEDWIGV